MVCLNEPVYLNPVSQVRKLIRIHLTSTGKNTFPFNLKWKNTFQTSWAELPEDTVCLMNYRGNGVTAPL